jgi:predicted extracellular nuclease
VRKKQAAAVRKWINARLTAVPSLYMIVAGEFNDYPFAEPLDGADYPVAIAVGNAAKGETVFINAYDSLSPDARYTCIVNGRAQMTEQLMMNPKLASRAIWGDVLHFNANYEGSFISDSTTAIRCSGHDPIEVRF